MSDGQLIFIGQIASGIGCHPTLGIPGRNSASGAPDDWPQQLYPGTLNVQVNHYPDDQLVKAGLERKVAALDKNPLLPAFEIPGSVLVNNELRPTESDPSRGDAQVWRARIRRPRDGLEVPCWVLRRRGSSVGEQLELVAGERLRDLGLQDGDSVIVVMNGQWNPAYPNADDTWMPCMTLLLQEVRESPEALAAARRFFASRNGPSATTFTVMSTAGGQFAWVKRIGDTSHGAGHLCGQSTANGPLWTGPIQISASLASALAGWCAAHALRQRPETATPPSSDDTYEARGIALAVRLKGELGESVTVLYRTAGGDPTDRYPGNTVEIVADTRRLST